MLLPSPTVEMNRAIGTSEASGASDKVPAVARFLPSLTDLAFLMPLIFVFLRLGGARALLGDGDTGWHVRTGEWILAHHQVPHTDFFSFTRNGQPWFAWEWLSDVLFALLHQRWGLAGVVLASLAIICLTSVALFRLVRMRCSNGLVAIAVTLLATGGCAIHWLARPHLFTLLFFVVTLHITARAAEGRVKLLAWLVPLTLLWTNLHGGFFVVFLVLACYIASDLVNAAIETNPENRGNFLRSTGPWLTAAAACFAVTFINPYGWELHRHLISYITDSYAMQHIQEFQAMDFHSPITVYFEPLMFMGLVTALWDARCRRFADCFLTIGWLHLALIARRNVPFFMLASAPFVARAIVHAIGAAADTRSGLRLASWVHRVSASIKGTCESFDETDRLWRFHLAGAVPLAMVGALLLAPRPAGAKFTSTYDPEAYPDKAIPVLLSSETHHIFADDEWGDYLIYRLYPSKLVFVDGRSDFYGDAFGERYLDLLNVKFDWEKTLDRYDIDTVVLSPRVALASTLKISRDWRVAHDDGVAVVFRRTTSRVSGSLVSSDEGKLRDRAITKTITGDHGITLPTT
jgi:hypothetical protein